MNGRDDVEMLWWCLEHNAQALLSLQPGRGCWKWAQGYLMGSRYQSCRMVEKMLVEP